MAARTQAFIVPLLIVVLVLGIHATMRGRGRERPRGRTV